MGRGITMDEWVHFDRLPDQGRVPNSSYWYVHCRHCARGFEQKQLLNPPAKLTGRRSAMKAHLKVCPMYATQYKMEQRALAAAAAAVAATSEDRDDALAATGTNPTTNSATAPTNTDALLVGTVTIKTQSGEKRKRRGEDVEASGPRGGRGKHCMMEEWEHFIRLQDEGYIGKSNFFFAVCRHCQAAYDAAGEDKKPLLVPEKLVGRREKMRKHLAVCQHFKGELPSMERRSPSTARLTAFLPLPTSDGVKMVPASALAAAVLPEDGQDATAGTSTASSRLALDEWQFFTRLHRKKDSAYYFARCNFCQQALDHAPESLRASMAPTVVMGRKSNMQTHLAKCPYVPKDAAVLVPQFTTTASGSKRLKTGGETALHQTVVELLLQHALPFEFVDSASARKLLRLAAAGANWHASMLPSSAELRGPVLDDLIREEFQPDVDKLKHSVALPDEATGGTASVTLPVAVRLALAPAAGGGVPTADCELLGHGTSVPLQYVAQEEEDDGTALLAGDSPSKLAYFHGLDLARSLSVQLQRLLDEQQLPTAVLVAPPSPVVTRAAGILRARSPGLVLACDLHDVVAYCLQTALKNADVASVLAAATELLRAPEVQAATGLAITPASLSDWRRFAAVAPELLTAAAAAHVNTAVPRDQLATVLGLLRSLGAAQDAAASGAGLADSLSHLASLFAAADGFPDVQRALEAAWHGCEQPLYLLALALHPQLRLRSSSTKLSALSDLSVAYFSLFFQGRKPQSLRGDVTSFLHTSQPVFGAAFVAEFPVLDDYVRYLRDNFAELAALMELLQSLAIGGGGGSSSGSGSGSVPAVALASGALYAEEEQRKLSLLAARWGVESDIAAGSGAGTAAAMAAVEEEDEDALVKDATVVATWLRTLEKQQRARLVDYAEWDAVALSTSEDAEMETAAAATASDSEPLAVADVPLPSLPQDDAAVFPSQPLPAWRGAKVRLAHLFAQSTTV